MPLYWWTDTEVPYWYKGKALPARLSTLSVIALPNVANARDLSYRWESNDAFRAEASGVGRASFSLLLALPLPEKLAVTVQNISGSFKKTEEIAEKSRPCVFER